MPSVEGLTDWRQRHFPIVPMWSAQIDAHASVGRSKMSFHDVTIVRPDVARNFETFLWSLSICWWWTVVESVFRLSQCLRSTAPCAGAEWGWTMTTTIDWFRPQLCCLTCSIANCDCANCALCCVSCSKKLSHQTLKWWWCWDHRRRRPPSVDRRRRHRNHRAL